MVLNRRNDQRIFWDIKPTILENFGNNATKQENVKGNVYYPVLIACGRGEGTNKRLAGADKYFA